jgi:bifunctional DNA-binding transcriptional regulator/antitoxin component of YhaV-PrlF toxin-antitoxin module
MGKKSSIDESWRILVPEELRDSIDMDPKDTVRIDTNGNELSVKPANSFANLYTGVSRRNILFYVTSAITIGGFVNDRYNESDRPDSDVPLVQVLKSAALVQQSGVEKFDELGEIDSYIVETLDAARPELEKVEKEAVEEEVNEGKVRTKHITSITGPLGSDLVALSMGYDLETGANNSLLPYYFDITPTKEHKEKTIDKISNMESDWVLKGRDGFEVSPNKADETMGDSTRNKHTEAYGTVIVKPVSAGWEDYNEYKKYRGLTEFSQGNKHIIVAGCHGEGTMAAAEALRDDEFRKRVQANLGSVTENYQFVVKGEIEEYVEETDPNGNEFYKPSFNEYFLSGAMEIPSYD